MFLAENSFSISLNRFFLFSLFFSSFLFILLFGLFFAGGGIAILKKKKKRVPATCIYVFSEGFGPKPMNCKSTKTVVIIFCSTETVATATQLGITVEIV